MDSPGHPKPLQLSEVNPNICIFAVSCISVPLSAVNTSVSPTSSRIVTIWICLWSSNSPLISQNLLTSIINKILRETYKEGNNYANIYSFFPLRLIRLAVWYRKADTFERKQERGILRAAQWRVCGHLEVTAEKSVLCQKSKTHQEASLSVMTYYSQNDLWEESWEGCGARPVVVTEEAGKQELARTTT